MFLACALLRSRRLRRFNLAAAGRVCIRSRLPPALPREPAAVLGSREHERAVWSVRAASHSAKPNFPSCGECAYLVIMASARERQRQVSR